MLRGTSEVLECTTLFYIRGLEGVGRCVCAAQAQEGSRLLAKICVKRYEHTNCAVVPELHHEAPSEQHKILVSGSLLRRNLEMPVAPLALW